MFDALNHIGQSVDVKNSIAGAAGSSVRMYYSGQERTWRDYLPAAAMSALSSYYLTPSMVYLVSTKLDVPVSITPVVTQGIAFAIGFLIVYAGAFVEKHTGTNKSKKS